MRTRLMLMAVALIAPMACWDFEDARDAHCAKEGAFCFDGGSSAEDGGPSDSGEDAGGDAGFDAGEPDAGGADGGDSDAGEADAGPVVYVAQNVEFFDGLVPEKPIAVALPQDARMMIGASYWASGMFVESLLPLPGQVDGVLLVGPPNGAYSNLTRVGNGSDDHVTDVAGLAAGAMYMAGTYWDYEASLITGPDTTPMELPLGAEGRRLFVARVGTNGNPMWAERIEGSQYAAMDGVSVAATSEHVVASGWYEAGAPIIDGGSLPPPEGANSMVVSFDPNGAFRWHATVDCVDSNGVTDTAKVLDLAAADGLVAVAGFSVGDCYVTPADPGERSQIPSAEPRAFLVRMDSDGGLRAPSLLRPQYVQGSVSQYSGVAATAAGELAAVGNFTGTVKYGTLELQAAAQSVVVVRYDAQGTLRWAKKLEPKDGGVSAPVTAVSKDGLVYVAGSFSGLLEANEGASFVLSSGAGSSAFLARFAPDGGLEDFLPIGTGDGNLEVTSIAVSPSGDLALAGFNEVAFTVDGQTVPGSSDGGMVGFVLYLKRTGG